ncbi:hypothetical protein Pla22_30520 [Rubripirellula amarantea]|uniref:Uncharacterized protein n=1 Tax=Rubripirellula amarantea TaxID=2527999 RepID=A0A5C5WI14_9BACT|nr:hypothetical protein [Rubripirellula amarantea]TWT50310.1 hypothetical protein Pla22_30520 [Rubripirellula amarantea]
MTIQRMLLTVLTLAILTAVTPRVAFAQRGTLIEDLFRTITEAQLERERIKAAETARRQPPPQRKPMPPTQGPAPIGSINVGSPEMARFAKSLSGFTRELGFLVTDLQGLGRQNASVRRVLPASYQVAANADALLRSCDGLSDFGPIANRYASLDADWRQLSFELRSLSILTSEMSTHVRDCDRYLSTMSRQMGVSPQLDRHGLHDKMLVAATYMQALLDDLKLCVLSHDQLRRFTHDGRLLRQSLLAEADRVDDVTYEELSSSFTDFVARWRSYSQELYAIGNPHISARLDRIGQCGEETYAMLWMRPPVDSRDLVASSARLRSACTDLMDQLTLRAISSLNPDARARVSDGSRRMDRLVREFDESIRHGAIQIDASGKFQEIDSLWNGLRSTYVTLRPVNPATIATIDRECDSLRRALRVTPSGPNTVVYEELMGVAASLEGTAEYFKADIARYERYFQPASFGQSISHSAHDFYAASKRLHARLSDREDIRELQRGTEQLVDAWQRLSGDVSRLRQNGVTGRRAENLERAANDLAPLVATIAAALLK